MLGTMTRSYGLYFNFSPTQGKLLSLSDVNSLIQYRSIEALVTSISIFITTCIEKMSLRQCLSAASCHCMIVIVVYDSSFKKPISIVYCLSLS